MRVAEWSPSYERLMDWLEKSADLKRDLEALPTTETLRERLEQGQGLTSPGALGAGRLRQDRTRHGAAGQRPRRRPVVPRDPPGLLPEAAAGTVRRRTGHPPAAPGDHRDRRGQRHDQHGRHHLRVPGHGGDLGHARPPSPRRSSRSARSTNWTSWSANSTSCRRPSRPSTGAPSTWTSAGCWTAPSAGSSARATPSRPIAEIVAEFKPLMDPMRARLLDYLRGDDRARVAEWLEKARGWDLPEDLAPPLGGAVRELRAAGHRQDRPRQPGARGKHRPRLLHGVQPLPRRFPARTHHQAAAGRTAGRRWPARRCATTCTPPSRT